MSESRNEPMVLFSRMLRSGLGKQLHPDAEHFVDMLSNDAVMEFPYAPAGLTRRLDGKAAVQQHLASLGGRLRFDEFTKPVIHQTGADTVILEFSCTGSSVQSGAPYNQDYISVITLRDGRIVHYRDYWNPLVVLQALQERDNAANRENG